MRAGESGDPPPDLVLVGRILDAPPPKFQRANGGKMIKAHVETWITDLYRASQWWIELPSVEDVADVDRRRLRVRAVPLGAPGESTLVGVANGSMGRMRLEGIALALFDGGERNGWEMVSGTPPAWFANVWDNARGLLEEQDALAGRERGDLSLCAREQLANEFKNAKVYLSRAQILETQRDWLHV